MHSRGVGAVLAGGDGAEGAQLPIRMLVVV